MSFSKFKRPKKIKWKNIKKNSVLLVEYGDYDNFVKIILKGYNIMDNRNLKIYFSYISSPKDVLEMYELRNMSGISVLENKQTVIGTWADS